MLAPNATAVITATEIANTLIAEGWQPQVNKDKFTFPADENTPKEKLPVARLRPPGEDKDQWFLELLGAPQTLAANVQGETRYSERVETFTSHFEIPSFAYLGVTQFEPVHHESGLQLASVATMALSNLLHHPRIEDKPMSAAIEGHYIKRANKDLGRVIAMAFLADQQDENAIKSWPSLWKKALQELNAPPITSDKLGNINSGIEALLQSREDQDEALHSINNGLLANKPINLQQLNITIRRYLKLTNG